MLAFVLLKNIKFGKIVSVSTMLIQISHKWTEIVKSTLYLSVHVCVHCTVLDAVCDCIPWYPLFNASIYGFMCLVQQVNEKCLILENMI